MAGLQQDVQQHRGCLLGSQEAPQTYLLCQLMLVLC